MSVTLRQPTHTLYVQSVSIRSSHCATGLLRVSLLHICMLLIAHGRLTVQAATTRYNHAPLVYRLDQYTQMVYIYTLTVKLNH